MSDAEVADVVGGSPTDAPGPTGGPRDLGPIQGHEVPGSDGGAAGPTGAAGPPGSGATDQPLGIAPVPAVVRGVGDELRRAARDIRDVQRRGDVPNSRPLPDWVRRLAWILDDAFAVPGTAGRRVGVDGMLTLVPVAGDLAGLTLSMVVVLAGVGAGVTFPTTIRMLLNVGLESLVGLVPFGGAIFDMFYKANNRNVRLIERDLADRKATRRSSLAVLALTLMTIAIGAVMTVLVMIAGVALVVWFVAWLLG